MIKVIQLSARRQDPEAALWRWLRPQLAPYGHVARVENPLDPGMPDVSFAMARRLHGPIDVSQGEGWLELKALPAWPKTTLLSAAVDIGIRPAQRAWWHSRLAAGGRVMVLLRVGSGQRAQYMLYTARHLLEAGSLTKMRLLELAVWRRFPEEINGQDLAAALTGNY